MITTKAICAFLLVPALFAATAQTPTNSNPEPLPPITQGIIPLTGPTAEERAAAKKASESTDYLPVCSTEKVNKDCKVNINRLFPYSYPGFMIKPGAKVTVRVFNPFIFENLTLEPSPANVYEPTDQASTFASAVIGATKGVSVNGTTFTDSDPSLVDEVKVIGPAIVNPDPVATIRAEEATLGSILEATKTKYIVPWRVFRDESNEMYRQMRNLSLLPPRPVIPAADMTIKQNLFVIPPQPGEPQADIAKAQGFDATCSKPNNPWAPTEIPSNPDVNGYPNWRDCMIHDLLIEGNDLSALWNEFPNKCQPSTNTPIPLAPWTQPVPQCNSVLGPPPTVDTVEPTVLPSIPAQFDATYATLTTNINALCSPNPPGVPNAACPDLVDKQDRLKKQRDHMAQFLSGIVGAAPPLLTKVATDMQSFYMALLDAPGPVKNPTSLGEIPPPTNPKDKVTRKYLGIPVGLAPAITYNVNEQNILLTPLLQAPATTQRITMASLPLTYANPRFETSTGVFLSWLPNRTYANVTNVSTTTTGTTTTPTPTNITIGVTTTNPPLFIPYYAAHYKISPEWTWLGGRRGAFYLTGALGINPYLTDLEYAAGFGISWRYLMFSPVYHLGRSTHLTNGLQVGQVWCTYMTPPPTSGPPACPGSTAPPTTKNYLRGAFAIGIGVRVPTTFVSTNH